MKVFLSLTISFLFISTLAYCQTEVYRNSGVLEGISRLQAIDAIFKISETNEIQMPVPKRRTSPEDSTMIEYRNFTVHTNRVIMDVEKVKQVFPEVISSTSDGRMDIDYYSLIAVLFEAMGQQQAKIEELNRKISLLEGKSTD